MKALIQQTIERAEALRALTGGTPEDQAVAPLPTKLIVEATSNCNLACVYCPTSKIKDPMNMPLATYQKILGRLEEAGMAARISINGNGEPTMNPDFFEMVNLPHPDDFVLQLITNASLLNQRKRDKILDSRLNFVQFSIDSVVQERYDKARPSKGGKPVYKRVFENVLQLVKENEQRGHPLYLSVSILEEDPQALERELGFWRPLLDNAFGQTIDNWAGNVELGGPEPINDLENRPQCGHLYDYIYIRADGQVKGCCEDVFGQYIIGNVHFQAFEEIWNGEPMRRLRRLNADPTSLLDADLNGLQCAKCDVPWRNGASLESRVEFAGHSLYHEMRSQSFRSRPTVPSQHRIDLADAYLDQLNRQGEITEILS